MFQQNITDKIKSVTRTKDGIKINIEFIFPIKYDDTRKIRNYDFYLQIKEKGEKE